MKCSTKTLLHTFGYDKKFQRPSTEWTALKTAIVREKLLFWISTRNGWNSQCTLVFRMCPNVLWDWTMAAWSRRTLYNYTMTVYVNYTESGNAPICGGVCNMGNKKRPLFSTVTKQSDSTKKCLYKTRPFNLKSVPVNKGRILYVWSDFQLILQPIFHGSSIWLIHLLQ